MRDEGSARATRGASRKERGRRKSRAEATTKTGKVDSLTRKGGQGGGGIATTARARESVTEAETVGVKDNKRGRVRSGAGHRRYVEGDEE